MKTRHANHPFLDEVTGLVADAGVNVEDIISDSDHPAVQRGVNRVKTAIEDGEVQSMSDYYANPRNPSVTNEDEVFSYAVARIIVSAVNDPRLVDRYARAEAKRSVNIIQYREGDDVLEMADLWDELDFGRVAESSIYTDGYELSVSDYLTHADLEERKWSIRSRTMDDGRLHLPRRDLYTLMENAIANEIGADLPLNVPDSVRDGISDEVQEIRNLIKETTIPGKVTGADVDAFPQPFDELYRRAAEDETLSTDEYFVLIAFLDHVGFDRGEIQEIVIPEGGHAVVGNQVENIVGNDVPPPGYDALVRMGIAEEEMRNEPHPVQKYKESQ